MSRPKTVTVKQIQRLDKIAINKYGVPSLVLMENAGRASADQILKSMRRIKAKSVLVLCGLGNNAGDGFVVARLLNEAKVRVSVLLVGQASSLKGDALVNYKLLKKLKIPLKVLKVFNPEFKQAIRTCDIVVDALFGVGLNREIESPIKECIDFVNKSRKYIIAIDIPSGLDGTTGKTYGVCVKARKTITFSFVKKGMLISPQYSGNIIVADIGIPKKIQRQVIK